MQIKKAILLLIIVLILFMGTSTSVGANKNSCQDSFVYDLEEYLKTSIFLSDDQVDTVVKGALRTLGEENIATSITVLGSNKAHCLNLDHFIYGRIVYGDNTAVSPNDYAQGQYRYVGLGPDGIPYTNIEFPADFIAQDDVSKKRWIYRPWETPKEIYNSTIPEPPVWQERIIKDVKAREDLAPLLYPIVDKYSITSWRNTRGNWNKPILRHWKGTFGPWNQVMSGNDLIDYSVISQKPGGWRTGSVTMWSRSIYADCKPRSWGVPRKHAATGVCYKDWYDTFTIYSSGNFEDFIPRVPPSIPAPPPPSPGGFTTPPLKNKDVGLKEATLYWDDVANASRYDLKCGSANKLVYSGTGNIYPWTGLVSGTTYT
jgi:hypothetical protein